MSSFAIKLASSPASAPYCSDSLVSFDANGAQVHLTNQNNWVRELQQASRKIAGLGNENIKFGGEWTQEQQLIFVQSFCSSAFTGNVEWAEQSDHKALNDYLKALLFTRQLVNQTPQEMSPQALADKAQAWLQSIASNALTVKRYTGEELKEAGWMGIYEVGRGSVRPPVLLEIDYNPNQSDELPVALVGKGITFDSGGYSIKSSEGMLDMKCDMGGAATLTGALGLAIMQGLQKRVKLFLCCAENLISGHAYKLGDVITYKNGTTVEVVNTDAEGRLVLADGLMAASEAGAKLIIDAATLTGAAVAALGKEYNAVFSMHQDVCDKFMATTKLVNEQHWQLPLEMWHQQQCPSPFAQTANSRPQKGGGAGGASNAAGFLSRFVDLDNCQWIHLDLAGAYSRNATELMPAGGTALGLRSVAKTLLSQ